MTRWLICLLCLFSSPLWALEFSSGKLQTTVIELYTSEGCSSCPPADRWLSSLKSDPRLFNTLIPLAFHVDYWDGLGWPDRFANAAYSQRQRELAQQSLVSQVYTPGLVVNSQEWRGWFNGMRDLPSPDKEAGLLSVNFDNNVLDVGFSKPEHYQLNIAVLGMGLKSEVSAGENSGRQLEHDFVVLDMYQQTGSDHWQIRLGNLPEQGQQQTALAVWLTEPGYLRVIQAAAAYID